MKLSVSLFTVALFTLLLSGCETVYDNYAGPGTTQDFINARYQCFQETSQRQSSAYVNQYGGGSSSTVMPLCNAFTMCLASKGYYKNDGGRFSARVAPVNCR